MPLRFATATLFLAAAVVAATAALPQELPAVALGQASLYRLEILLALVYSGLLLLMPFFQGVLYGRLPVELSHRGARWPEAAEESLREAEEEVAQLTAELDKLRSKHFPKEEL